MVTVAESKTRKKLNEKWSGLLTSVHFQVDRHTGTGRSSRKADRFTDVRSSVLGLKSKTKINCFRISCLKINEKFPVRKTCTMSLYTISLESNFKKFIEQR